MSRVRFLGSAAMALAYVAKGAIDCFQMDHLQPWDVAAGVLIICEAGGTVIDTKGALIKWIRERKNLFFFKFTICYNMLCPNVTIFRRTLYALIF